MYRDWREGRTKPLPPGFPSPNDPYYHPKMLGWGAYAGALVAGAGTTAVGLAVPSPPIAWLLIGGIWALFFAAQMLGWHRYLFRVRQLALAEAKSAEAKARLADLIAKHAADKEARESALAKYRCALDEGMEALQALASRARNSSDRKRHLRAQQDFLKAQTSAQEEPDLATRLMLQSKAMKRETQLIKAIRFSF